VEYEDTISIATPEGVELEMVLAGAGSRASAALLDLVVKIAVFVAVFFLARGLGLRGGLGEALLIVLFFLLLYAYDVLFEVLASGRTPGKRWSGLRVVREGGRPIGFGSSAVRNVLRVVDALPGVYAVGVIAVAMTRRNQRLGDLAAGSLVVRERRETGAGPAGSPPAVSAVGYEDWDVTAVTPDELATVRQFLDRRDRLRAGARERLAVELADALRSRVGGVPPTLPAEALLEGINAAKAARR